MSFRDLPIRRKLMSVLLAVSALMLLITCTTFIVYELLTFRQGMVKNVATLGQVIAANSTAALAFDNAADAAEVLDALRAEPHVVAAGLYDRAGHLFARFPAQAGADGLPAELEADGYRFERGRLVAVIPVTQHGNQRLGTLHIETDLDALYARLRLYGEITAAVIALSLLLAFVLSRFLQQQIAHPILRLAQAAKSVSEDGDYSVRVETLGRDEVSQLTGAFNQMLAQIQQQHRELTDNAARVREQLDRLNLLHRITRAIGERQDLPSIFQVLIRSLEDSLAIDFGCICLHDAGEQLLSVTSIGARGVPTATALGMTSGAKIAIDGNGLADCLRGNLVYEPEIAAVSFPFPQRLAAAGLGSVVFAPLAVESKVFGVLIASRRAQQGFSSVDCEFLRQLSEHAGLAAHQAQLYGALQQAYDDLRQTQQAILQQERLRVLGQMASGIAHDINNAISPVALYTESLLEKETGLSANARRQLETIQRAVDDVAQTVLRMREFYRHRDTDLTLAPVKLNQLVPQVIDLTRARWYDIPQQRGVVIELRTELAPGLPAFMGVESEIREALTNLVFNAVDAMPDGGTLSIRTGLAADAPSRVYVDVIDSGVGMDADTQRRCLEPFFTTKGERGTGLGLSMVYGMVKRHSADIEVESAPGRGTRMRLLFLVMPQVDASPEAGAAAAGPRQRLRILVIDDDPLVINSLRDTLQGDGHAVTAADGGQNGIDEFLAAQRRGQDFSVVITDLGMPYVDGRKVAAAIKAASRETPIIMLTGWGQRLVADRDVPAEVDKVLNKPPKLQALREALVECCASSGAKR
ncbi:MAG: response regulator [Nevskia sp.]|nr:response regulator [Nevskia sp.]